MKKRKLYFMSTCPLRSLKGNIQYNTGKQTKQTNFKTHKMIQNKMFQNAESCKNKKRVQILRRKGLKKR